MSLKGLEKIKEIKQEIKDFMPNNFKGYKDFSNIGLNIYFSAAVIQKTIDIVDSFEYAYKNKILSVQTSLLRLLCDNCVFLMALYPKDKGGIGLNDAYMYLQEGKQLNTYLVPDKLDFDGKPQYMVDGYLKRLVDELYPGFAKIYNYASKSVHFSFDAIRRSAINLGKNGEIILVSNKDNKHEISIEGNEEKTTVTKIVEENNEKMIVLCKIIFDLILHL